MLPIRTGCVGNNYRPRLLDLVVFHIKRHFRPLALNRRPDFSENEGQRSVCGTEGFTGGVWMKLFPVFKPNDRMFVTALDRVVTFAVLTTGSSIPPEFFAGAVAKLYGERSPLMCLLLVLDDQGVAHGHGLAMVENSFGRVLGWVYQAKLDNDIPMLDRRRLIREGMDILTMWAKENRCVALAMATQRSIPAMARRFGFAPTHTLMEHSLEGR
jgi:hypothetical protein